MGFRVGPSVLTQNLTTATTGSVGPAIDAQLLYDITRKITVGLDVGWDTHSASFAGFGLGRLNTVNLMPFGQYRFIRTKGFAPYAGLGLGVNLNFFSSSAGTTFNFNASVFQFLVGVKYYFR